MCDTNDWSPIFFPQSHILVDNSSLLSFLQSQIQQDKALNPPGIEETQGGFQPHLLAHVRQYNCPCVHHGK